MKLISPSLLVVFASFLAIPALAGERLEKLRTSYDEAVQTQVIAKHTAAVADLDAKFLATLDAAIATAAKEGKLDLALALRAERKRLADHQPQPDDDSATPDVLKALRQKYDESMTRLQTASASAELPLLKRYNDALKALEADATKAGELDEAVAIRSELDYIKVKLAGPDGPGGASQPQEVSEAGLQGRRFIFGRQHSATNREPLNILTLSPGGKIAGAAGWGIEFTWKVENGKLNFYDDHGVCSTAYHEPKWKDNRACFLGDFLLTKNRPPHFLDELAPVKPTSALLGGKRLTRKPFEFAQILPAEGGGETIELKANGDIAGGKFGSTPKWKVDENGLLTLSADDKPVVTFDSVYTWNAGKTFYLEGKALKQSGVVYRLRESPN